MGRMEQSGHGEWRSGTSHSPSCDRKTPGRYEAVAWVTFPLFRRGIGTGPGEKVISELGLGAETGVWRRERDSNPRWHCCHSCFQDNRLRPLGHPSGPGVFRLRFPQRGRRFWKGKLTDENRPLTSAVYTQRGYCVKYGKPAARLNAGARFRPSPGICGGRHLTRRRLPRQPGFALPPAAHIAPDLWGSDDPGWPASGRPTR